MKPEPVLSTQAEAHTEPLPQSTVKPQTALSAQAEAHAEPRAITSLPDLISVVDRIPVLQESSPGTGLTMQREQALTTNGGDAVKQTVDTGQMDSAAQLQREPALTAGGGDAVKHVVDTGQMGSTTQLQLPTLMSPWLQLEEATTQSDGHAVQDEGGRREVSPSDMSILSTSGDALPGQQALHRPLIAGLAIAAADGSLDPVHAGDDSLGTQQLVDDAAHADIASHVRHQQPPDSHEDP